MDCQTSEPPLRCGRWQQTAHRTMSSATYSNTFYSAQSHIQEGANRLQNINLGLGVIRSAFWPIFYCRKWWSCNIWHLIGGDGASKARIKGCLCGFMLSLSLGPKPMIKRREQGFVTRICFRRSPILCFTGKRVHFFIILSNLDSCKLRNEYFFGDTTNMNDSIVLIKWLTVDYSGPSTPCIITVMTPVRRDAGFHFWRLCVTFAGWPRAGVNG